MRLAGDAVPLRGTASPHLHDYWCIAETCHVGIELAAKSDCFFFLTYTRREALRNLARISSPLPEWERIIR